MLCSSAYLVDINLHPPHIHSPKQLLLDLHKLRLPLTLILIYKQDFILILKSTLTRGVNLIMHSSVTTASLTHKPLLAPQLGSAHRQAYEFNL